MKHEIYDNRQLMGTSAAKQAAVRIRSLLAEQDAVNIIFAAAPSQNEFLAALTQEPDIDWKRVNAFHMDEYVGLDDAAPQRFGRFLEERIFGKLPFNVVNYIHGNAASADEECNRYAVLLEKHKPDVVCMGIGENSHIAFNDPHVADFADPVLVKKVTLDEACRQQQVNDGCFATLDQVPEHALTLTVPALMRGRYIFCMVPGPTKAQAVMHTLQSSITEIYPATILRTHQNAVLYLDKDSASLLNQ
ncbi:glucosamine-6-phosphate deaminase [Chitinophaga cymbidii]|uniref:Glucosamine-6-phosphate deaminase n=1 Tax=Chitinophaga cymbidii TaxID=1096750 RepID=A0A512REE9_9BACT|nr:glucosamine-6-phosphate deaminase [Chitinophaga cymbidii]GEP94004.1 glucosamine-6-phosphate deaminase [Chitinophaga cymbidii]